MSIAIETTLSPALGYPHNLQALSSFLAPGSIVALKLEPRRLEVISTETE